MNIMTKKCEACGTRSESDCAEYHTHAVLETPEGQRREICAACTGKLLNP